MTEAEKKAETHDDHSSSDEHEHEHDENCNHEHGHDHDDKKGNRGEKKFKKLWVKWAWSKLLVSTESPSRKEKLYLFSYS